MKIGEAQQIYREQIQAYQDQKIAISKKLKDVRSKATSSLKGQEQYRAEADSLELTLTALDEKQTEYQDYLNKLSEQYCAYWNVTIAEQQADAAEEYAVDMAKILEVARRIMKGGIVPATDEKKLMEFSMEMYQMAKNIGSMVQREKKEKYKTLWEEEEEKGEKEYNDPQEVAENAEAASGAPEIVEVAETIASVTQSD